MRPDWYLMCIVLGKFTCYLRRCFSKKNKFDKETFLKLLQDWLHKICLNSWMTSKIFLNLCFLIELLNSENWICEQLEVIIKFVVSFLKINQCSACSFSSYSSNKASAERSFSYGSFLIYANFSFSFNLKFNFNLDENIQCFILVIFQTKIIWIFSSLNISWSMFRRKKNISTCL